MPSRLVPVDASVQSSAHGAIMKPFSRSGAMQLRHSFTSCLMLSLTGSFAARISRDFRRTFGYPLPWDNPRTLNEKLNK